MDESSKGERLISPFVGKVYDISNAALFYAHNGRIESAQEKLNGPSAPDTTNTYLKAAIEPAPKNPPTPPTPPAAAMVGVVEAKS